MSDVASALQKLATYRSHNSRESRDTFDKGIIVLKSNAVNKMGDDGAENHMALFSPWYSYLTGWSFLEQLALAAIDVGRIDIADVCHGSMYTFILHRLTKEDVAVS